MNITLLNQTIEVTSFALGFLAMLLLVIIKVILKKLFHKKIKLANLRKETEKAHFHLGEANKCLQSLHKTFTTIENKQEEILNGTN